MFNANHKAQTMKQDMNKEGKRIRTECKRIIQDVTTENGKRYTICEMRAGKYRYQGTVMLKGDTIHIHRSVDPFHAFDMIAH